MKKQPRLGSLFCCVFVLACAVGCSGSLHHQRPRETAGTLGSDDSTMVAPVDSGGLRSLLGWRRPNPTPTPTPTPAPTNKPTLSTPISVDATTLFRSFEAHGFDCHGAMAPSNESGVRCRGMIFGYPEAVNFFVPARFTKQRPVAVAYHFHGWWTEDWNDPFKLPTGDYGRFLTDSGKNVILVMPESKGKDDRFMEIDTPEKVIAFFSRLDRVLTSVGLRVTDSTPRAISGHSGAYKPLAVWGEFAAQDKVPVFNSVRSLGFFDSIYEFEAGIVSWGKELRDDSFRSYFFSAYDPGTLDDDKEKKDANLKTQQELGGNSLRVEFVTETEIQHMAFMQKYMTDFFRKALP